MKSILLGLAFCAGAAWAADEAADRTSIEQTISAANVWPTRVTLFTADFEDQAELASVVRFGFPATCPDVWREICGAPIPTVDHPGEVVISKEPWGEATWIPAGLNLNLMRIRITRIRFLTQGVALVDAAARRPLLIVMKKVGTDWKIASMRSLAENQPTTP